MSRDVTSPTSFVLRRVVRAEAATADASVGAENDLHLRPTRLDDLAAQLAAQSSLD